jgi:hypothetical protein
MEHLDPSPDDGIETENLWVSREERERRFFQIVVKRLFAEPGMIDVVRI